MTLKNLSVLLLVGMMLFPVGINQSYAQSNIANMINDPDLPAPTAPALTVDVSRASHETITIPFSEIIPAVSGNTFEQLTVTFSLGSATQPFFISFTDFTGTSETGLAAATSVLEVTGDTVTMMNAFGPGQSFFFDYTVTNTNSVSASGVITIEFVDTVVANPYTVTLPNLNGLPIIDLPISRDQFTDELLVGSGFGSTGIIGFSFTTNATGNATGTLTVTPSSVGGSPIPIFHYTPTMFGITEAFSYTVTFDATSDSSTLYIVVPAATDFNFATSGDVVGAGCLTDAVLTATPTGVSGTLGGPASAIMGEACFRNDRTWQAFILNAGTDNDILDSTTPVVTSGTDMHTINFDDLDPETNYRAVLLLTGEYSGGVGGNFFSDVSTYRVTTFSTPEVLVDDPTAPDQTIDVFSGTSDEITIPFSEIVPPVSGNTFEQLFITLGLGSVDFAFGSFSDFTGTNATSIDSITSVLEVTGNTVTLNNGYGSGEPLRFDYTVTNTAGDTASGVITVTFANFVGDVMANPYTVTLADLSELPTVTRTILVTDVTSTILAGTQVAGDALPTFTFSDIGTGDASAGESAIGDQSGTLVVTNPTFLTGTMLAYTPVPGFSGTETFDYTVSLEGESDSSQFIFVVPSDFAPDVTVEALIGNAGFLTIPFVDFVSVPDNVLSDLTIIFTLQTADEHIYDSLTGVSGALTDPAQSDDTSPLTVDTSFRGIITINSGLAASYTDDIHFDYSIEDKDGNTNTGVITIVFVNLIGDFMAKPYPITLDDLTDLPTLDITIPRDDIADTLFEDTKISNGALTLLTFTTNGTGLDVDGNVDTSITGNASGTLTVTNPTSSSGPVFHYTPTMFDITEAFEYTVTSGTNSDTSVIYFVIPVPACETNIVPNIDFGPLSPGQESDDASSITISNTGNQAVQPSIHATNWISDVNSGITVMNVDQTKYSLTANTAYAQKTALTDSTAPAPIGDLIPPGNNAVAYLQLVADLLPDESEFRGPITQTITVAGPDCSD